MTGLRTCAALFAVLSLTACAGAQSSVSSLSLFHKASPESYASRNLDDAGVKSYIESHTGRTLDTWPLKQWTVDQLTLASFHYHPELNATEAWALRNRIVNALVDYYAANHFLTLHRMQKEVLKSVVDIFEQRSVAGQGLNLNASQILIMYQQSQLAEKDAQVKQAEAQAALAGAMGVPFSAVSSLMVAWPEIAVTDNDSKLLTAEARDAAVKKHSQLASVPTDKMTTAQFDALQSQIISAIELAQVRYKAAREKLRTGDGLLTVVKEKTMYLPNQVGDGELSKLPSLLAQSNIDLTSIRRLEAQVEWLKAKAALEYALEEPLFGDPVDIGATPAQPAAKP